MRRKNQMPTAHQPTRTGHHPRQSPHLHAPPPPADPPPHGAPPPPHPVPDPPIAARANAQAPHAQNGRNVPTATRRSRACRTPSVTSRRPAPRARTRRASSVQSAALCCRGSTPRSGIGAGTRTRGARPQSGPSVREAPHPPHTPTPCFADGSFWKREAFSECLPWCWPRWDVLPRHPTPRHLHHPRVPPPPPSSLLLIRPRNDVMADDTFAYTIFFSLSH